MDEKKTYSFPRVLIFLGALQFLILLVERGHFHLTWEMLVFVLLGAIGETACIPNSFNSFISIGGVIHSSTIFLFKPFDAAIVVGLSAFIANLFRNKSDWHRIFFNTMQLNIAIYFSGWVHSFLLKNVAFFSIQLVNEALIKINTILSYIALNTHFVATVVNETQKVPYFRAFVLLLKNGWLSPVISFMSIPLAMVYQLNPSIFFSVIFIIMIVARRALTSNVLLQEKQVLKVTSV